MERERDSVEIWVITIFLLETSRKKSDITLRLDAQPSGRTPFYRESINNFPDISFSDLT